MPLECLTDRLMGRHPRSVSDLRPGERIALDLGVINYYYQGDWIVAEVEQVEPWLKVRYDNDNPAGWVHVTNRQRIRRLSS